jgi:hypothetical protein
LSALSEKLLGLPEHRSAPRSVPRAYSEARPDLSDEASSIIEGNLEELNADDHIIDLESPDTESTDTESPDA